MDKDKWQINLSFLCLTFHYNSVLLYIVLKQQSTYIFIAVRMKYRLTKGKMEIPCIWKSNNINVRKHKMNLKCYIPPSRQDCTLFFHFQKAFRTYKLMFKKKKPPWTDVLRLVENLSWSVFITNMIHDSKECYF